MFWAALFFYSIHSEFSHLFSLVFFADILFPNDTALQVIETIFLWTFVITSKLSIENSDDLSKLREISELMKFFQPLLTPWARLNALFIFSINRNWNSAHPIVTQVTCDFISLLKLFRKQKTKKIRPIGLSINVYIAHHYPLFTTILTIILQFPKKIKEIVIFSWFELIQEKDWEEIKMKI